MKNILAEKSELFAIRIVKLSEFLTNKKQHILSNQILRSGTSIGANIAESEYSSSKADFINKLHIAQKEANETKYWLTLLNKVNYLENKMFESLNVDVEELLKLLASSIKTAKNNKE